MCARRISIEQLVVPCLSVLSLVNVVTAVWWIGTDKVNGLCLGDNAAEIGIDEMSVYRVSAAVIALSG